MNFDLTHLGLPLPQHWIRRSPRVHRHTHATTNTTTAATSTLGHLSITTSMVRSPTNAKRIRPHPLLRLIKPLGLKLLLTNRTHRVCGIPLIRDRDVLDLGAAIATRASFVVAFVGGARGVVSLEIVLTVQVDRLDRAHPVGLVDIPAAVLAALLSLDHALMHAEVPVHVCRLLLLAFLVGKEAAAALGTRGAERLVEGG